jgi:hypothetical protein
VIVIPAATAVANRVLYLFNSMDENKFSGAPHEHETIDGE